VEEDEGPTLRDRLYAVGQVLGGFWAGIPLGLVPGGALGQQAAVAKGLIPAGSRSAQIGLAVGEIFGGAVLSAVGATGDAAGFLLSGTGVGALGGVPLAVVSTVAAVGGAANVGAGVAGLAEALQSRGSGSGTGLQQDSEPSRVTNPSKSESPVWRNAKPYKDGLRQNGNEIWDWDKLHNDIEVYDSRGRHLGSRNPTTGEMYKPAVPGRRIDL
jgi:hypothetical protein